MASSFDGLDPYAPPRSETLAPVEPVPGEGLTRAEVDTFAGRKGRYYWHFWSRARPGRRFAGFNWAAAIFNLTWLLYRRMYSEFAVALGAAVTLGVGELFLEPLIGKDAGRTVSRIDSLALGLVVGFLGNWLYLRRARAAVARARLLATPAEQHAFLASRGGTSWLAVLISLVVSALVAFAAYWIGVNMPDR
jgi:hypothetical protein